MFEECKGHVRHEVWVLARPFKIARGIMTDANLVVVTLQSGEHIGQGECCPVAHYGESLQSVMAAAEGMVAAITAGGDWDVLHDTFPAGAARNAVDCAVWDLRAKIASTPVWTLAGLTEPGLVETVFTISLDDADIMAEQAVGARAYTNLKVKLGSKAGDIERMQAVRSAAPDANLIIDANEGWDRDQLVSYLPQLADLGVLMVEQPLPAGQDAELEGVEHCVPLGADESCHTSADVEKLKAFYDVVNIKLDKTGGLTEALRLHAAAKEAGLQTMVGCMLGTSLAMAPGVLLAGLCKFVDLDAPLLMGNDRAPKLRYNNGTIFPPHKEFWG